MISSVVQGDVDFFCKEKKKKWENKIFQDFFQILTYGDLSILGGYWYSVFKSGTSDLRLEYLN